jgi:hypothetical protein
MRAELKSLSHIFLLHFIVIIVYAFIFVDCDIDLISKRRTSYYKLYKAINNKICEESTIGGKLNYNNSILDKFDDCSKLEAKIKVNFTHKKKRSN